MKVELVQMNTKNIYNKCKELTAFIIPLDSETDTFLTGNYACEWNNEDIIIYVDNPIVSEKTDEACVYKIEIIHAILSQEYYFKTGKRIEDAR